jgi:CRP-like cAMP-binding protein
MLHDQFTSLMGTNSYTAIRAFTETVLRKKKGERSISELSFIAFILERFMFRSKYLSGWEENKVLELCRCLRWRRVSAMTPIYMQGTTGHEAYLLLKGTVRFLNSTNDEHGAPCLRTVCDGIPGDSFGELALLGLNQRKTMVLAVTWVELITISESDFKAASKGFPSHLRESLRREEEADGAPSPTQASNSPSRRSRRTIIGGLGDHKPRRSSAINKGKPQATESDLLQGKLASLSSEQKLDFIQKLGCMEMLNPYQQFHIASRLAYKFYPKGALIHKQGVKADCLTFLYKGDVALVKTSRPGKKTKKSQVKRRLYTSKLQDQRLNAFGSLASSSDSTFALEGGDSRYKVLGRHQQVDSQTFHQKLSTSVSESRFDRNMQTNKANIHDITTSQSFTTHDGVRKSGVTVARLAESACFGESGVLASLVAVGSGRRVVEKHNAVAATACHVLVLLPENYKRLTASVLEHLYEQVACRRGWEFEREKSIIAKQKESDKQRTQRSYVESETQQISNAWSSTSALETELSTLFHDQPTLAQITGPGIGPASLADSCWGSSKLFGSTPLPEQVMLESGVKKQNETSKDVALPPETSCVAAPADGAEEGIILPVSQEGTPPVCDGVSKVVVSTNSPLDMTDFDKSGLQLSPCGSAESQSFKNELAAAASPHQGTRVPKVSRLAHQYVGPMRSFEAMAQFPTTVQPGGNGKSFCGSKITKPFTLQYQHDDTPPIDFIGSINAEVNIKQYAQANACFLGGSDRRVNHCRSKGLSQLPSSKTTSTGTVTRAKIEVVGGNMRTTL